VVTISLITAACICCDINSFVVTFEIVTLSHFFHEEKVDFDLRFSFFFCFFDILDSFLVMLPKWRPEHFFFCGGLNIENTIQVLKVAFSTSC